MNSWKQVTLGELLSKNQARRVVSIINRETETVARNRALRAYLDTIKEQLEEKGVDPSYLAYYLEYLVANRKV